MNALQSLTATLARAFLSSREKGLAFTLRGLLWKLETAAFKARIHLEDRFERYRYQDWIRDQEPNPISAAEGKAVLQIEPGHTRFSIVIQAGENSGQDLHSTLHSLRRQTYPAWDAGVIVPRQWTAGKGSTSGLGAGGQVRFHPSQGDPAGLVPLLQALETASGEYIIALEAGDVLAPQALEVIASSLREAPRPEIVYSDEDHISQNGPERLRPFFKPDWSPELMLSVNYLAKAFFDRGVLQRAATSLPAEGALTFGDLVFVSAERAGQIHHIPEILVHRRPEPPISSREGADRLGDHLRQVAAHLARRGVPGPRAEAAESGAVRVSWPAPDEKVSLIIPTRDRVAYLRKCLRSIRALTDYPDYEIILVDSGSKQAATFQYYAEIKELPGVRIVPFTGGFNFSAALNLGARHARGEILLFLNNDTEALDPFWLAEMARWAALPEVGVVGGKLLYPNGTVQHAGIVLGMEGHASHVFSGARDGSHTPFGSVDWYRNYSAVTGACMAMRREVIAAVGGFDESYRLVFSDIEICLRAVEAGYRVVYSPFARLIHHEGKSRRRYIPPEDIQRAYHRFKGLIARGDPYYNPNLSHAVRFPTFRRAGEDDPLERLRNIARYYAA